MTVVVIVKCFNGERTLNAGPLNHSERYDARHYCVRGNTLVAPSCFSAGVICANNNNKIVL